MRWLSREGDTKNVKLVKLLFFVLAGVALFGLLYESHLVPSPSWWTPAAIFGLLVALAALVALIKDRNPNSPFSRFGTVKRLGALALVMPFTWGIGFSAVWMGVPSIWASVALDPKETTAVVTHVMRERTGRGCHHYIGIEGSPLPKSMEPCVSKALWKSVKAGHVVQIRYTDGPGAFVIHDIDMKR